MNSSKLIRTLLAAGIGASASLAQAADADRITELEKQLRNLQIQLEELKKSAGTAKEVSDLRDQVNAQTKESVVVGDLPNSTRVPGSDASVRIYGIAEMNLVHESKGDNSNNDYSTFMPYMPLQGSKEAQRKGQTYLHARTSRLGIEAATPSPFGMITGKIEGDFNNDPRTGNSAVYGSLGNIYTQQATNSYNFRLRHAYVQTPNWLFGQTWSTFMDIDNTPETVDFNGPIGSTFIRQPQIRYTYITPEWGNFAIALENSLSYVLDAKTPDGAVATPAGFSKVPDLVVRWDKPFTWGSLSLRAVSHEHRLHGEVCDGKFGASGSCNTTPVNTSRRGQGLAASGQIKTWGDDFISWIFTQGDGIGRYFNYIEGAGYNLDKQRIELEKASGLVVGYQRKFSNGFRMNFVYGMQRNANNAYTDWTRANDFASGRYAVNRSVSQLHIGGIWNPVKVMDIGLEYINGRRETLAGERGTMSRVNLLARYNFN